MVSCKKYVKYFFGRQYLIQQNTTAQENQTNDDKQIPKHSLHKTDALPIELQQNWIHSSRNGPLNVNNIEK